MTDNPTEILRNRIAFVAAQYKRRQSARQKLKHWTYLVGAFAEFGRSTQAPSPTNMFDDLIVFLIDLGDGKHTLARDLPKVPGQSISLADENHLICAAVIIDLLVEAGDTVDQAAEYVVEMISPAQLKFTGRRKVRSKAKNDSSSSDVSRLTDWRKKNKKMSSLRAYHDIKNKIATGQTPVKYREAAKLLAVYLKRRLSIQKS